MKTKLLKMLRNEADKSVLLIRRRETSVLRVEVSYKHIVYSYSERDAPYGLFLSLTPIKERMTHMRRILIRERRRFILGRLDDIKLKVFK